MTMLAIAAAAVTGLVVNLLWFSRRGFFPAWWRALGRGDAIPGPSDGSGGSSMALEFGLVSVALVVQSIVLAVATTAAASWLEGAADPTLGLGALVGLVAGVGIAATSSLGHRVFSGQGLLVWAIEVGGDVASLAAMGAVLGLML